MSASSSAPISMRMGASDWAQLLLLSLIWGMSFFLIAIAVRGLPVLTVVAARVLVAAVVLWAYVLLSGRSIPRDPKLWLAFLVIGALNNVIPFSLISWGQTQIPSGLASILNAVTPLSTVLVTAMFLADERPTPAKIAGVVLGLGGVAIMMGLDTLAGHRLAILPQIAVLGATLSYACAGTFGRRFARMGIDPIVTAAGMVTGSSILLVPVALLIDGPPPVASVQVWGAVLIMGTICTGLAYVLYFNVLARAGATNISLVTFLVPVSAILLGWLFLEEELNAAHVFGMVTIAAGLLLIDGRLKLRHKA